jgi:hypothetical protein
MNAEARLKALECERAAALATDVADRTMYLDLARQWRQMAETAQELERRFCPHKKELIGRD